MKRSRHIPWPGLGLAAGLILLAHGCLSFCLALEGLRSATTGVSSRWISGDRGDPMLYRVDTDLLPSGITTNQALTAISNAFQAWASVSSLSFQFDGLQSFGTSPAYVVISDSRIRVQLHDKYHYLNGALGYGGRAWTYDGVNFTSGGLGGRITTNEFDLNTRGWVVINNTNALMSNPVTLTETLCHEIGHALSLDHSSTNPAEGNSLLKQAVMYYAVHADGRGAALNSWDTQVVQQAYPTNNTPPYGYDRIILALTSSPQHTPTTGVNRVEIRGLDRQTTNLTMVMTNTSLYNGTFSFANGRVSYAPTVWVADSVLDPAGGSAWDRAFVRISDGTNASPYIDVNVTSLLDDSVPRDQLPDSWANLYGVSGATNDPDKDGFGNLFEWVNGTNPTNGVSEFAVQARGLASGQLSWPTRPYEVYQVESTTNLAVPFSACGNPIPVTTSSATNPLDMSSPSRFFRLRRVP